MTQAEPTPPDAPSLDYYPIQLAQVFCADAGATRRERSDSDSPEQLLRVQLSTTDLESDQRSFHSRIEVAASMPVLEDEYAEVRLTVQGDFVSEDPISTELHQAFAAHTPLVQLWPYARGFLAELGTMLGVDLPPLPLINALHPGDESSDAERADEPPG